MHPDRSTLSVLVATALLAGCADPSAPTGTAGSRPASNFMNGPDSPGLVVVRTEEDRFLNFIPDFDQNLTAFIGGVQPVSNFCNPALPFTVVPLDAQYLFKPTGTVGALWLGSDLPVYVYDVAPDPADFFGTFCSTLTDEHIIATGTVRFVYTNRDEATFAFGYRATGTVTLTSGGSAHVSGEVKWVTTGSGDVRVQSHLTLTPAVGP